MKLYHDFTSQEEIDCQYSNDCEQIGPRMNGSTSCAMKG